MATAPFGDEHACRSVTSIGRGEHDRGGAGTCIAALRCMLASSLPESPDERQQRLAARRALKMARSAHAYVRGSTQQFYEWLESASAAQLPSGPLIWICGDAHVGNVGPVGRGEGPPVLELRDLDQTVIGNPAHDLVRLGLSLAMAARSSALPGVTTARMTEELVAGYENAFGASPGEPPPVQPDPIKVVMKRAIRRTWKQLFREELEPTKRRLRLGRRFWPLSESERAAVDDLAAHEPAIHRLVTQLSGREEDSDVPIHVVDAAYWVKGCSSLGLWRTAVLVEVGCGPKATSVKHNFARSAVNGAKGKKTSLCLLDLKQAIEPVTPHMHLEMPQDPAERVVVGARNLAPTLGERMVAVKLQGKSLFARELMPQDLKLEIEELSDIDARGVAFYLGNLLGRAHARQLDVAAQRTWRGELLARHSKEMEAPNWLWSALVELIGIHERAYLEHCRTYALASAA